MDTPIVQTEDELGAMTVKNGAATAMGTLIAPAAAFVPLKDTRNTPKVPAVELRAMVYDAKLALRADVSTATGDQLAPALVLQAMSNVALDP